MSTNLNPNLKLEMGEQIMGAEDHRKKAGHGPVTIAIVTVSDTRTPETDQNRQYIENRMNELSHHVAAYRLIKDEPDQVAAFWRVR